MDLYLRVRPVHLVERMGLRQVARMFNLHRNTVKKMLEYSVPSGTGVNNHLVDRSSTRTRE